MSTRSVVAYKNADGEVRGTYVHYDGFPDVMLPELKRKFSVSYENVVEWIEAGIAGQGYSSVEDLEPYNDGDSPILMKLDDEEYGYLVHENGEIEVHGDDED